MDVNSTDHRAAVAPLIQTETTAIPTPAPYGRACLACAKAKCKCLTRSDSNICERCFRLRKECHPSEATRKRNKKSNKLEEKLDGILSLLTANGIDTSVIAPGTSRNAVDGHQTTPAQGMVERSMIVSETENVADSVYGSTTSFPVSSPHSIHFTGSNIVRPGLSEFAFNAGESFGLVSEPVLGPSPEEAENLLAEFRSQILVDFAFIYIPARTTAQKLRQERPVLFLAIMAVCSKSSPQRLALGHEIKQKASREILVENEGNFDLLLGLLVFLTWGHDQFVRKTQLMSRFMHLAMSMTFELRLNKPPMKDAHTIFTFGPKEDLEKEEENFATWAMEERRAVLGCYALSTIISWYFAKIEPMRWTPYMDECLRIISLEQESPTDEMFAHQVRLLLIAERVAQTSSSSTKFGQSDAPKAHLPFYLNAFRSQLVDVKRKLSPAAEHNQILLAHIHHTELCINSLALSKDALDFNIAGFERLDSLSSCLNSIKSWFDIFLAIPTTRYLNMSFPFFTQLAHSIFILFGLSTFEDPAWDRALVRSTIDIRLVLDQLINNFRLLCGNGGDDTGVEIFEKMAFVFGLVKSSVESRMATEEPLDADMQDIPQMDPIDDTWLSEVLGSWSYDFVSK